MGLDTTHEAWHGAYSAFTRWRNQVATAAGYEVAKIGDPNDYGYRPETALIDWGHITQAHVAGEWDATPADPLLVLIVHSDCDGVIHPAQAGPLADRLEELLPLLPEGDGGGHIGDWQGKTRRFIDGLRLAVASGEDLEFH
jgi:hypothetical protein